MVEEAVGKNMETLKMLKRLDGILAKTHVKGLLARLYYIYEDFLEGGVIKKNSVLKDAYGGKSCFILCTGSSLKEIDLAKLNGEYVYGCNFLYKHKGLRDVDVTFYAIPDSLRIFETESNAKQVYMEADRACNNPDAVFFVRAANKRFLEKHGILKGRKVHYIKPHLKQMKLAPLQINDLTKRITLMEGVVFFMIATSIYMGFSELYLCGCGYTYYPLQSGHFYEDWTKLDYKSVNIRHHIMKKFADDHGVKIYNVVPDGFESPIYEKVSWEHVLNNVLRKNDKESDSHGKY